MTSATLAHESRIHLISPPLDSMLDLEAPELEVSVWAPGADFRARLNGLDVTERFAAPVEGVRSARFERGWDFELGRGSFLAAVGEPSSAALETVGFGFTAWQVVETSAVTPLALEHGATALLKRVSVNGRTIVEHRDHGGRLAARSPRYGTGLDLHNTIKLGDRSFNSALIDNGMTAAQLVVLDFGLALVANATFIIYNSGAVDGDAGDPARGAYGHGVKGHAAALEHFNRNYPGNTLIILQTFGQGQWWGNTPAGSPSWVNDDAVDQFSELGRARLRRAGRHRQSRERALPRMESRLFDGRRPGRRPDERCRPRYRRGLRL
jgi:hypothetical protein